MRLINKFIFLVVCVFNTIFVSAQSEYIIIEHIGEQKLRVFSDLIIKDEADSNLFFEYQDKNLATFSPAIDSCVFDFIEGMIFKKTNESKVNKNFEWGILKFTLYDKEGIVLKEYISKNRESSIKICSKLVKRIPPNENREMLVKMFSYYIEMFEGY